MLNNIDRLYIHVPFCSSKCAYCTFHSIPVSETNILIDRYLAKLEQDLKKSRHLLSPLQSIFLGGGTPSCLRPKNIEKIFSIISDNCIIAKDAEISIESNPESLTEDKIKVISGFANRISLGVQSFNDKHRAVIGRTGRNIPEVFLSSTGQVAKQYIEKGRISRKLDPFEYKSINQIIESFNKNNISNISIDLIYGIPTQTVTDWEKELGNAIKLPIKHLSAYALTIEEGSRLYPKYNLDSIEAEDVTADMWKLTSEILSPDFARYEISNYSRPGYECKHNLDIWFGGKYLGLGPAASSFDGQSRWTQQELDKWLKGNKPDIDDLPTVKRTVEIFIMGLRTTLGWIIEHKQDGIVFFESQFMGMRQLKKPDWKNIDSRLITLNNSGLLKIEKLDNNKIKISPTEKGLLFWNEIAIGLL